MRPANNDRDSSVERLLQQTARARQDTGASSSCPDSEALSAWAEESLLAAEQTDVEAHIAVCARCQAILAAMVRAEPPAVQPERWWRRRFVPVLVPLAAATVLAVWLAVPPHEPPASDGAAATIGSTNTRVADKAAAPAPATADAPAPVEPAALAAAKLDAPAAGKLAARAAKAEAPAPSAESAAAPRLNREDKLLGQVAQQERRERTVEERQSDPKDKERLAQAAAGSRAAPSKPSGAVAAPAIAPPVPLSETVVPLDARFAAKVSRVIEIISPDSSRRWRVNGGVIQRSTDGGATWTTQESNLPVGLTAGSSPSPDVCWIVGRAGAVLLSTDGRSWRRLQLPEAIDLVSVRAIDATTATVTSADGRVFITKDAGLTWVPGALAERAQRAETINPGLAGEILRSCLRLSAPPVSLRLNRPASSAGPASS